MGWYRSCDDRVNKQRARRGETAGGVADLEGAVIGLLGWRSSRTPTICGVPVLDIKRLLAWRDCARAIGGNGRFSASTRYRYRPAGRRILIGRTRCGGDRVARVLRLDWERLKSVSRPVVVDGRTWTANGLPAAFTTSRFRRLGVSCWRSVAPGWRKPDLTISTRWLRTRS